MANKKVIFIRSVLLDKEIRSQKEINAIKKFNYDIKLLNWNRDSENKGVKKTDKGDFEEIQLEFRAPAGIKVLPYLIIWWTFNFFQLMRLDWDIVHAVNMDAMPAAILAAKIKRKKVIYEILDIVEFSMVMPVWIRNFFLFLDKFFTRLSDAVVVVDEEQANGMGGIPNSNVFVIYDSPPESFNNNENNIAKRRSNHKYFTLFYAGVFFKNRKLYINKLVEAIKELDGFKLILAGYGNNIKEVKRWSTENPDKIKFLGMISYEDVIKFGKQADLFFILRDPDILVNKYTCGSTLFNAMICKKPLIVNKGTSSAKKVTKHNCGVVLNVDIHEIKENLINLKKNPELCDKFGKNGFEAYSNFYSWSSMVERIGDLYNSLENNK